MTSITKTLVDRIITKCLSDDLLSPMYLNLRTKHDHISFGHCYVATEAAYHIYGKFHGYKPYVMRVERGKYTHWFLKDSNNNIIDPTIGQYKGKTPKYAKAKCTGFLTKQPSKRAQIIIDRYECSRKTHIDKIG